MKFGHLHWPLPLPHERPNADTSDQTPPESRRRDNMTDKTAVFDVFAKCVEAKETGENVKLEHRKDKEFHFQNWFQKRVEGLAVHFEGSKRNSYPDFTVVEYAEGYEIKGLEWPGRVSTYDSNSQVPTGYHQGRQIFYVFGRYPKDRDDMEYPVVDLVICHGDFLNADRSYVHKNKNVKGFGSYGDIMIRDRKMYAAPTPFSTTDGTTGLMTLILPERFGCDDRYQVVGNLTRVEADTLVAGYRFDLRTNELTAERVDNSQKGIEHRFVAYRLKSQASKPVSMKGIPVEPDERDLLDDE